MSATFTPERLGRPTAVSLSLALPSAQGDPPPIATIAVHYPRNLSLATSELGLATCSIAVLELDGPSACPPNSRMGNGTATVAYGVGDEPFAENVGIALVAGPSPDGYIHLLAVATGEWPVIATIVMPAVMHPGELLITVPPVPGPPGGPYVSLSQMHVTIGGHLTYYEHSHGRLVAFQPPGIALPPSCPHGGFRFATDLTFLDGTRTATQAVVACPRRHH